MPDLSTWRKALAGDPVPLHENDPQPGYWRMRQGRGGPFLPVAIWREPDGSPEGAARRRARPTPRRCGPGAAATRLPTRPMSPWPSAASPGPTTVPADRAITARRRSGAGDQLAGDIAEPADGGRGLAGAWRAASPRSAWADKAANFAERFAALEKQAEEQRTLDKRPVLEAGRAIDAAWKPVIDAAARGQEPPEEGARALPAGRARAPRAGGRTPPRPSRRAPAPPGGASGCAPCAGVQVTDRDALSRRLSPTMPGFWAMRGRRRVLLRLAEADLAAGRAVAGAVLVEDHVAA